MPTNWTLPTSFAQFAEADNHIAWDDVSNYVYLRTEDNGYIKTVKSLIHISNSSTGPRRNTTHYLLLTNFPFINLPDTISGIEVEIKINRGGRITDDTIQLRLNDEFIGENKANSNLDLFSKYGSSTDMWATELTRSDLQNPNFGIGIRFQSHLMYPHNDTPMLDYVKLRVW